MKAQEAEAQRKDSPSGEHPNADTQTTQQQTPEPTSTQTQEDTQAQQTTQNPQEQESKETPPQTTIPEKIEIEGVGEVDFEELKKGYLRQSDYTKKAQQLASQRKEVEQAINVYEHLRQNPELAQKLVQEGGAPQSLDPTVAKIIELEQKLYDMMLYREIETLQNKYEDFEVKDVLETAHEKGITNLEDAYFLVKSRNMQTQTQTQKESSFDLDSLKKQIREEILNELKADGVDTSTTITSRSGASPEINIPKISQSELKVATSMGMSPEEYIKWRDVK